MKSSLFLAALGTMGALLASSCSEDRKTEAAAATPTPTPATSAAAASADAAAGSLITTNASPIPVGERFARDTAAFRADARRLAGRVAADLKLADPATERRLEKVYFARRRRQAQVASRYAADTAGRAAALRQLNADTDRAVRQVLPSPALARTYETARAGYYDGPLTVAAAEAAVEAEAAAATSAEAGRAASPAAAARPVAAARTRAARRGPRIVKYKKSGREVKIKYSNGVTLKIDEHGHRKVKYGLGAKAKAALEGRRRKARQ